MGRRLLALALALACGAPSAAAAYVRTTTAKGGTPFGWFNSSCVYVRVNSRGLSTITDGSDIAAVRRAMDNWTGATKHCSYMRFHLLPDSADAAPGVNECGVNESVIFFEEESWPDTLSPDMVAYADVRHYDRPGHSQDGRILDSDIRFNANKHGFSASGEKGKHDIENILTHELGHLLGLAHNCDDGRSESKRPIKDHLGATIPLCSSVAPADKLVQATMYFNAANGETHKRSPEADDIAGVCAIYPIKDDPGTCQAVELNREHCGGCSCAVAGRHDSSPLWSPLLLPLLALACLGLLAALRRTR